MSWKASWKRQHLIMIEFDRLYPGKGFEKVVVGRVEGLWGRWRDGETFRQHGVFKKLKVR